LGAIDLDEDVESPHVQGHESAGAMDELAQQQAKVRGKSVDEEAMAQGKLP
jgi:hypothetical protein